MKNLYESLLDDEIFKGVEDTLNAEWLRDNCRSEFVGGPRQNTNNYKIRVLKDGSLKIKGDLRIKDVNAIPYLRISKFEGDLHIEDCGITSLSGLFVDKNTIFKGNIYITDCDNLVDISDIPLNVDGMVQISGCKSLRSLEGVDCLSTNVSITKCGKKFNKSTIQQHFKSARSIFCSEEGVQANICESFKDPVLTRLWEQLKNLKLKINMREIMGPKIEIDKIKTSDRLTYKVSNAKEKDMLKVADWALTRFGIVVTEMADGTFKYLYGADGRRYTIYEKSQRDFVEMRTEEMCQELSFKSDTMKDVEFVHIIDPDYSNNFLDRVQKRREAREGKGDTIIEILKQQRERYDKAVKRIKSLQESKKYRSWISKVDKILTRFSAFVDKYIKEDMWRWSIRNQMPDLLASICQGYKIGESQQRYGVVYAFQKWSYNLAKAEAGEDRNISTETLEQALKWADETLSGVGM